LFSLRQQHRSDGDVAMQQVLASRDAVLHLVDDAVSGDSATSI
jgi:hypothetical protein